MKSIYYKSLLTLFTLLLFSCGENNYQKEQRIQQESEIQKLKLEVQNQKIKLLEQKLIIEKQKNKSQKEKLISKEDKPSTPIVSKTPSLQTQPKKDKRSIVDKITSIGKLEKDVVYKNGIVYCIAGTKYGDGIVRYNQENIGRDATLKYDSFFNIYDLSYFNSRNMRINIKITQSDHPYFTGYNGKASGSFIIKGQKFEYKN